MYVTSIFRDGAVHVTTGKHPVEDNGGNGGPPVDLKPEDIEGGPVISRIANSFGATIFDGPFAESKKAAKDMLDAMTSYCSTGSGILNVPMSSSNTFTSNTLTLNQIQVESIDERLSNSVDCLAAVVETLTKRGYDADAALECAILITKNR
jgi:hypothetical protein